MYAEPPNGKLSGGASRVRLNDGLAQAFFSFSFFRLKEKR